MKMIAWAWTSCGELKVERPIANCVEKPATMTRVITMAPPRKKRSSPAAGATGWSNEASSEVAIRFPPGSLTGQDPATRFKAGASKLHAVEGLRNGAKPARPGL